MSDLSGWPDEWDPVLRNGKVAEQTRVGYVRSALASRRVVTGAGPGAQTPSW